MAITKSASLWGCELKYQMYMYVDRAGSQPPCEAVSWNAQRSLPVFGGNCQPPCEAVSWNESRLHSLQTAVSQPPCEAVSWNAPSPGQLIDKIVSLLVRLWVEMHTSEPPSCGNWCQPPCEAVSWNILYIVPAGDLTSQPPCEAVSWNYHGN